MPGARHLLNANLIGVGGYVTKLEIDYSNLSWGLILVVCGKTGCSRDRVIASEHGLLSGLGLASSNSECGGSVFLCLVSTLARCRSLLTNNAGAHKVALLLILGVITIVIPSCGFKSLDALLEFSIGLPAFWLSGVRVASIVHVHCFFVDRGMSHMISLLKD